MMIQDESGSAEQTGQPPQENINEQAYGSTSTDVMTQEPARTSRGRVIKEPTGYQDFVKH